MNRWFDRMAGTRLGSERGAQLAEFAVALPLLVVFVVGIFDFSGALTLKQRLTNMARDAARAGAGDPSNDVRGGTGAPVSVMDVYYIVDNYLLANNLNDCGISSTPTHSGLTWTFTGSGNGCPSPGLTIIVNRGYYFPSHGRDTQRHLPVSESRLADCHHQHLRQRSIRVSLEVRPSRQPPGRHYNAAQPNFGSRRIRQRELIHEDANHLPSSTSTQAP